MSILSLKKFLKKIFQVHIKKILTYFCNQSSVIIIRLLAKPFQWELIFIFTVIAAEANWQGMAFGKGLSIDYW